MAVGGGNRARLAVLIATMAVVVLVFGGVSMYLLYDAAIGEQRARLHDAVRSHARLIEAVARYNADRPVRPGETAEENTLSQVFQAHERSQGFGKTGELVLARRAGDHIEFVLSNPSQRGEHHVLPIDGRRGVPMRLALQGKSGSVIAPDYRGETVVAAYEPVDVIDMGLVAKIDLSEIRAPFVRAAVRGGAVALLAILVSAFLFIRATRPLVRRAEASEAYNQTIVDSAADGIAIVDSDSCIVTFNPACERIFDRPAADAIGRPIAELIPTFASADTLDQVPETPLPGLRADGTEVMLDVTISGLPERMPGCCALFIRDVTERLRLEAELRHAHKMEAIGTLASGIAHDFNNLLMGISSTSEVALNKYPDSPAAEQLARIKATAVSGTSITRQLLQFGRRGDTARTTLELNSVVAGSEHMLGHLLGSDIELQVTLSEDPTPIEGDRGELEQILLNLAGNARHAMESGGTLSIAISNVSDGGDDFVLLTVSDTGAGMSEETRARIFEPFFTTKAQGSGTGLGLSSVYGIVKRHGGRIEVDSEPDRGTTFRLFWPRAARPGDAAAQPADDDRRSAETILLVEDESLVRQAIRFYLERAGYQVLDAASAEAALELVAGRDIDLLLTDIVLTGKSGPQLAELVGDVPAVFISAYPTDKLVRDGQLPPGAVSLQKPFTESELIAHLQTVLGPAAGAATGPDSTLLLVEDDRTSREACSELLADLGYTVIATANGAEALSASRAHGGPIDLVLTDLGLPDMTCTELISELDSAIDCPPVIYMSGRLSEDDEVQKLLEHPRSAFVQKPLDFEAVASTIAELIDRRPRSPDRER